VTQRQLVSEFEAFERWLEGRDRLVVASHVDPDGDAIGSTIALALWLEQRGRTVQMYNRDPVPYNCRFLSGSERVSAETDRLHGADGVILMDVSQRSRIGDAFPEAIWASGVAIIDHHDTWDDEEADCWVRDASAASVGELLFRMFRWWGDETEGEAEVSHSIAEALYTTLVTDTGSFQYSNTSKTTFEVAGELLEAGVDPWEMTSRIFENQPRERIELLKEVLQTLEFSDDGRLAFIRMDNAMFERTGTSPEMADGFINYGRSVEGVEVSTKLSELSDGGGWKVSFRSVGNIDVSEIASQFGGGGHVNAAGCQIDGTAEQVRAKLTRALRRVME
jgi:phosphoesterase RecJ-like protein